MNKFKKGDLIEANEIDNPYSFSTRENEWVGEVIETHMNMFGFGNVLGVKTVSCKESIDDLDVGSCLQVEEQYVRLSGGERKVEFLLRYEVDEDDRVDEFEKISELEERVIHLSKQEGPIRAKSLRAYRVAETIPLHVEVVVLGLPNSIRLHTNTKMKKRKQLSTPPS